jgi:cytochrome P450
MLGPAANHLIEVEDPGNFSWRRGNFGELTPLLGDGLITTDGETHDRARRIMMPAFHRRVMDAHVEVMVEETHRALDRWHPGGTVDVYAWIRELALRIAMRALLGLDPDARGDGHEAAEQFERALRLYGAGFLGRMLRGPGTPYTTMRDARERLDRIVYAQIAARRRRAVQPGGDRESQDALSMLLAARDEQGHGFTDRELRDHVVTLLFGGHDTSSSTLSFLLYELARHPEARAKVLTELDDVLGTDHPTTSQLLEDLPELDKALDETLRLYPPVWVSPRRADRAFEFAGHRLPAGTFLIASGYATHQLPDVWPDPERFDPERFAPHARKQIARGAYIPFGGGPRICIGKRFGQLVVKAVATGVLQRFHTELPPAHRLQLQLQPTISPRSALPLTVRPR